MNWNLSVMSGNSFGTYAEKLANKIQSLWNRRILIISLPKHLPFHYLFGNQEKMP